MKNENHPDEMVDILTILHPYVAVPLHEVQLAISKADDQVHGTTTAEILHKVLFGGDLLTAIRAKGAQLIDKTKLGASCWTTGRVHSCL